MENKILNVMLLSLFGVALILANSFSVLGFAVGASSLQLYPGQTYDAFYDVMNTIPGSSALSLDVGFVEGSNIASFLGSDRVSVPAGGVLSVPVRYRIPDSAVVGTVYPVVVSFITVSSGTGSGSVDFAQDVVKSISVTVIEKPETSGAPVASADVNLWWWILVVAVIVILVVWWVLRKKKK